MRVLLTGAKGNLGSALQRCGPRVEWQAINREDWSNLPTRMAKVDVVLHAASDLRTPLAESPLAVLDSNVMTTARLLEAAAQCKLRRFIFISSCAVYGHSQITSEATPLAPISANGLSKALGESVVESFCRAHGIKFEIYRIFNTFGGNDHFSILSHIKKSLRSDRPFQLNNGGLSQRDYIHVDDVARVLLKLLDAPPQATCLNIGSGVATKIISLIEAVREHFPDLRVQSTARFEAEYSRADLTQLMSVIGDYKFRNVLDFIRQEWAADMKGDAR